VRTESQTAGVITVEVAEIVVIAEIEQVSVDETEAAVVDAIDEHYPPD
jgi:hypothetical protein